MPLVEEKQGYLPKYIYISPKHICTSARGQSIYKEPSTNATSYKKRSDHFVKIPILLTSVDERPGL